MPKKKRNIDHVIKNRHSFTNIPRWQEKVTFVGVFYLCGPLRIFNVAFFFLAGTFIYTPYLISFS